MRIGEILLEKRWVEWEALALALDDHIGTGVRLASFLVARGAVDFDDASRALAEQFGVAAALRRHLERRDREAARLLPVVLARRRGALPLGRLGNGTLIVCVREPSDAIREELARIVGGDVALAVAPAKYLERIVETAYPPGTSGELDIQVDVDEPETPGELDFDLIQDDDASADADFAIDIEIPSEPAKKVSTSRALPVEFKAKAATTATRDPLDAVISACKDIDEVGWLLDVVMEYVAKRWAAALLFEIREHRAVGMRGHGARLRPTAIKTFVFALDEPSIVQVARDERRIVEALPDPPSEDDTVLATALAGTAIVAAPITKRDAIAYVLVVGDPIDKDPEETAIDLGLLTEAVADALARL